MLKVKNSKLLLIFFLFTVILFFFSQIIIGEEKNETKQRPNLSGIWAVELTIQNTDCPGYNEGDKSALLLVIDQNIKGELKVKALGFTSYPEYMGKIQDDGSFEFSGFAGYYSSGRLYTYKNKKSTFEGKLEKGISGSRIVSAGSCSIFFKFTGHKI